MNQLIISMTTGFFLEPRHLLCISEGTVKPLAWAAPWVLGKVYHRYEASLWLSFWWQRD